MNFLCRISFLKLLSATCTAALCWEMQQISSFHCDERIVFTISFSVHRYKIEDGNLLTGIVMTDIIS